MSMKLYVGGLAYSVTEQELENVFAEHGKVTSAAVMLLATGISSAIFSMLPL